MAASRAIVLFDIDGTLLSRAGPHHKEALVHAIREVTGHETTFDGIDTSGRLDRDLIRLLLGAVGARSRDVEEWLPEIIERAQSQYVLICPELQDRVCAGVRGFLDLLRAEGIPAGLVTGNLTAIGWKKVDAAGLRSFFTFGAFADMAHTRADLARIAIREAKRQGLAQNNTPISLVGDHPNDVEAAKLNGIRSIAVATGLSTREELAACKPDVLVSDLGSLALESLL